MAVQFSSRKLDMKKRPNGTGNLWLAPDAYDEIGAIHDAYVAGDDSTACAMIDRIWELASANGAAYETYSPSKRTGVHPCNRDHDQLNAKRAQEVIAKVKKAGFSERVYFKDAFTFEEDPASQHIGKLTESITQMAGTFAKYSAADVRLGTVGCSHLNHGIEQANQGVPCDIQEISVNGRMSKEKLMMGPRGFPPDVFSKGLQFKTFRWQMERMFPALPYIYQSGLNTSGEIESGMHNFLFLLNVFGESESYVQGNRIKKSSIGKSNHTSIGKSSHTSSWLCC